MAHSKRLSAGPRIELGNGESTEPIANFRGSFVIDHLEDGFAGYDSTANRKSRLRDWFFGDGWGDVGIWKSAVCGNWIGLGEERLMGLVC